MEVFLVWQERAHYDGGDLLLGIYTNPDAARYHRSRVLQNAKDLVIVIEAGQALSEPPAVLGEIRQFVPMEWIGKAIG